MAQIVVLFWNDPLLLRETSIFLPSWWLLPVNLNRENMKLQKLSWKKSMLGLKKYNMTAAWDTTPLKNISPGWEVGTLLFHTNGVHSRHRTHLVAAVRSEPDLFPKAFRYNLYCYTDMIQYQLVGDAHVPQNLVISSPRPLTLRIIHRRRKDTLKISPLKSNGIKTSWYMLTTVKPYWHYILDWLKQN